MNKLILNFALLAALSAGLSAHAQKKKVCSLIIR